jgi:ribosomal protein S5
MLTLHHVGCIGCVWRIGLCVILPSVSRRSKGIGHARICIRIPTYRSSSIHVEGHSNSNAVDLGRRGTKEGLGVMKVSCMSEEVCGLYGV